MEKLIKRFWQINEKEGFNTSVIAVYFFFLKVWDENKVCLDFSVSDTTIIENLKISRNTLKTSRELLRNLGLLNYTRKQGYSFIYKIAADNTFSLELNFSEPNTLKTSTSITSKQVAKSSEKQKARQNSKPSPLKETQTPEKSTDQQPQKTTKSKSEPVVKKHPLPKNIPTKEEFMAFARTLPLYDKNNETLDFQLETKYESWVDNGWINGNGRPITNWKISLKSTIPYLIKPSNTKITAPTIKRPKATYNE